MTTCQLPGRMGCPAGPQVSGKILTECIDISVRAGRNKNQIRFCGRMLKEMKVEEYLLSDPADTNFQSPQF